MEGKSRHFQMKEDLREFVAKGPPLKRMVNRYSLNLKKIVKEGILEYKEGRKSTVSKKVGKCNRLFFCWVLYTMFDD